MAITGSTLANVDYIVKTKYSKQKRWNMAAGEHVALNLVKRSGKFTGRDLIHPVTIGNTQGIANEFAASKANAQPHSGIVWTLTRAVKYGWHSIEGEVMAATRDDEGAFVSEITQAVSSVLDEWGNDAGYELYNDGGGQIGTVSGAPAANVVTLSSVRDAQKFEKNMSLVGYDAANAVQRSGAGTGSRTDYYLVASVDEDAGTITLDNDQNLIDTDILFRAGNRSNGIKGFKSWLPNAVTATLHFGVDRTEHPTRLGGQRVNAGSASDLDEAILDAAAKVKDAKGRLKWAFMNSTNFMTLVHKAGSKIERDDTGKATFGYEYIDFSTPAGTVRAISDPDAPSGEVYLIDPRSWVLKHLMELPHLVKDDGSLYMRLTDDDGIEFRARGWWQLVCGAPGHNAVVYGL